MKAKKNSVVPFKGVNYWLSSRATFELRGRRHCTGAVVIALVTL